MGRKNNYVIKAGNKDQTLFFFSKDLHHLRSVFFTLVVGQVAAVLILVGECVAFQCGRKGSRGNSRVTKYDEGGEIDDGGCLLCGCTCRAKK